MADSSCNPVVTTNNNCCNVECPNGSQNTNCFVYTGNDLPNLGITSNTDLNTVFEDIDAAFTATEFSNIVVIAPGDVQLLHTAPYSIVLAGGTNTFIEITSISLRVQGGIVPYTVGGSDLRIKGLNGTGYTYQISDAVLTTVDNSVISPMVNSPNSSASVSAFKVNDPIVIYHATADPQNGDSSLYVYVSYVVKPIS